MEDKDIIQYSDVERAKKEDQVKEQTGEYTIEEAKREDLEMGIYIYKTKRLQ